MALISKLKTIQKNVRFSYGAPRIKDALNQTEERPINQKRVTRILRQNGLNKRCKRNENKNIQRILKIRLKQFQIS